MKKIHCIHCNAINEFDDIVCKECNKPLRELDKYYIDLLKGDIQGKVKDNIFLFLKEFIKQHLYGIVLTVTVVTGVSVNTIVREKNADVIKDIPTINISKEQITEEPENVNIVEDEYSFETSDDAIATYLKYLDTKDYDKYNKLSYDEHFNVEIFDQLTTYGMTVEDFIMKYPKRYFDFWGYDVENHFGENMSPKEVAAAIYNSILKPMDSETEIPTGTDVDIPGLEDIEIYNIQIFACKIEKCTGTPSGQLGKENFSVVFVKVNGRWYYLYSSSAIPRSLFNYVKNHNLTNNQYYHVIYKFKKDHFDSHYLFE